MNCFMKTNILGASFELSDNNCLHNNLLEYLNQNSLKYSKFNSILCMLIEEIENILEGDIHED